MIDHLVCQNVEKDTTENSGSISSPELESIGDFDISSTDFQNSVGDLNKSTKELVGQLSGDVYAVCSNLTSNTREIGSAAGATFGARRNFAAGFSSGAVCGLIATLLFLTAGNPISTYNSIHMEASLLLFFPNSCLAQPLSHPSFLSS